MIRKVEALEAEAKVSTRVQQANAQKSRGEEAAEKKKRLAPLQDETSEAQRLWEDAKKKAKETEAKKEAEVKRVVAKEAAAEKAAAEEAAAEKAATEGPRIKYLGHGLTRE